MVDSQLLNVLIAEECHLADLLRESGATFSDLQPYLSHLIVAGDVELYQYKNSQILTLPATEAVDIIKDCSNWEWSNGGGEKRDLFICRAK